MQVTYMYYATGKLPTMILCGFRHNSAPSSSIFSTRHAYCAYGGLRRCMEKDAAVEANCKHILGTFYFVMHEKCNYD